MCDEDNFDPSSPDYDGNCISFPDYDKETRVTLSEWQSVIRRLQFTALSDTHFLKFKSTFCVSVVNILHLIVLTRKRMMTSSTNVIMIGMAICDVVSAFQNKKLKLSGGYGCEPPNGVWTLRINLFLDCFYDSFRRCSSWLAVLMALLRFLVLHFVLTSDKFSTPKSGLLVVIGSYVSSSFLASFLYLARDFYVDREWQPKETCTEFPKNFTAPLYFQTLSTLFYVDDGIYGKILQGFSGVLSKVVPSVALPLLTALLICEFQKAKRRRGNMSSNTDSREGRTTALVIFMAISFLLSELPLGIIYVVDARHQDKVGLSNITYSIKLIFNTIYSANSMLHCVICFAMSTQYRQTVYSFIPKILLKKQETVLVKSEQRARQSSQVSAIKIE